MTADPLLPQPPGGLAPGAALAVLVHVGLIAALTLGVGWHMKDADVVSAELWSSLPQVAAPRVEEAPAPTPAPPPPPVVKVAPPQPAVAEAKIAIERERKAREDKEKAEDAKKKREADDKKKRELEAQQAADKAAEKERLEKLREQQMKRMLGSLQGSGNPNSTGSDSADAAPSASYAGRLISRIRSNMIFSDNLPGNPEAEVEVRAAAGGTIISRRLLKSSGVKEWDEAVLRGIDRTNSLPADTDGRVPSTIIIKFRPKD